jgi:hypothetical protein
MIASAAFYMGGYLAWWACLLLNAFFASLTHELEHDLIHSMYFRKQRVPHKPDAGAGVDGAAEHHQPVDSPAPAPQPP